MTRVLFIGHDQGAAAMLLPVIRDMVADGEAIALAAAGPAAALWDRLPAPVLSPDGDGEDWWGGYLDRLRPELVVTGTGHYSDFERNCWRAARNIGIRTVAVIDAWVNFAERFERTADGAFVQPDAVCVIDDDCRERLAADSRFTGSVHVTGHPNLELLLSSATEAIRRRPPSSIPNLVFFSNPVLRQSQLRRPHFDQFRTASVLVRALDAHGPLVLRVKPHPREDQEAWRRWAEAEPPPKDGCLELTSLPSADLLVMSDGVAGISSMALIEASLLGRPVLALQFANDPDRLQNQAINAVPGITVVAEPALAAAAAANLFRPPEATATLANFHHCIEDACRRMRLAIESEMTRSQS